MRVLSLHQPWATLMAEGVKTIETRSWTTKYRGSVAIQATKVDHGAGSAIMQNPVVQGALIERGYLVRHASGTVFYVRDKPIPLGAIIAVANLVDVRLMGTMDILRDVDPVQEALGHWAPGRYAWFFEDVIPLRSPVPYRGSRGLLPLDQDQVTMADLLAAV